MSNVLGISTHTIDGTVSVENVSDWDSLQHINLILALEEAFEVHFSVDEIALMTSYSGILNVLKVHVGHTE